MKELILGPPGTGKTTELLNIVKKHLDEAVDPRDIGYFSFTKKAAIEAKSRAIEKFPMYTEEDFPYFRTLHSLAFNQLHLKKTQVMQKANYKEFGRNCGIPLDIKTAYNSEEDGTFTTDNEYLRLIDKSRAMNIPLLDLYDKNTHYMDIERDKLYLIDRELKRYKEETGLLDYGDMLQRFVESDMAPRFTVLRPRIYLHSNGSWCETSGKDLLILTSQAMMIRLYSDGQEPMWILSSGFTKKLTISVF